MLGASVAAGQEEENETCFACHGQDAKTPILPDYPRLAGQNEAYLLRQLKDIKAQVANMLESGAVIQTN